MDNPTGAELDHLENEIEMEAAVGQAPEAAEEQAPPQGGTGGSTGGTGGEDEYPLSEDEKDLLGEVGNICMGTSATTLSTLLGKKVSITTPRVSVAKAVEDLGHYKKPFLAVEVSYTEGVNGYNILLMQEPDVKVITDLLMGGEGTANPDEELDELHFSAISEIMNQMVGSSSTSLSNLIGRTVNITPPKVKQIVMEDEDLSTLVCYNDIIIKISFAMSIEGVLDSELMQLLPYTFGKELAREMSDPGLMENGDGAYEESAPYAPPAPPPSPMAPPMASPMQAPPMASPMQASPMQTPPMASPPQASPMQSPPMAPPPQASMYATAGQVPQQRMQAMNQEQFAQQPQVGVQSLQYDVFDGQQAQNVSGGENIGLILDVPLQITVELGKCKRSIKDILGFNMGSVIVLDRLAGEMVDIMVNGKLFARGEVVVIDDNYGVRVTDIVAMPQV